MNEATRHVLHALICQMNFCTSIKNVMKIHRVCKGFIDARLVDAGLQSHFPVSSLCLGSSEEAHFNLAPVQQKVSPTTFCSLSSSNCLLEQRDYSLCIPLYLSKWPSQISSLYQFFSELLNQPVWQQKHTRTKCKFICQQVRRQNVKTVCWEGGKEGKFRIMCKTIKMLLTGNLKQ